MCVACFSWILCCFFCCFKSIWFFQEMLNYNNKFYTESMCALCAMYLSTNYLNNKRNNGCHFHRWNFFLSFFSSVSLDRLKWSISTCFRYALIYVWNTIFIDSVFSLKVSSVLSGWPIGTFFQFFVRFDFESILGWEGETIEFGNPWQKY